MAITESKLHNISKLSYEDRLTILDYIINEALGVYSVTEYVELTGEPKSTIYNLIKTNKLKSHKICGINFIIIND